MGQPKAGLMTGRLSTVTRESGINMEIWKGRVLIYIRIYLYNKNSFLQPVGFTYTSYRKSFKETPQTGCRTTGISMQVDLNKNTTRTWAGTVETSGGRGDSDGIKLR